MIATLGNRTEMWNDIVKRVKTELASQSAAAEYVCEIPGICLAELRWQQNNL